MPRTRSKGVSSSNSSKSSKPAGSSQSSESRYTLSPESANQPKIFILPKSASKDARVVSLLNPRYNKPTRYLVCPEAGGIWEFTKIAAPKTTPRSWLIECPSNQIKGNTDEEPGHGKSCDFGAYVTKGAELYIATPVDPLFLILPAFDCQSSSKAEKKLFLSSDDHFDTIPRDSSPHFSEVLRWGKVRQTLEGRMGAICDTVDAGDESMYRLSEDKLLDEVLSKARRMSAGPLPASMEEKFVTKALEAPFLGVKRTTVTTTVATSTATSGGGGSGAETPVPESEVSTPKTESQSSVASAETTATTTTTLSEVSTSATSTAAGDGEEEEITSESLQASVTASAEIVALQRLRVAFNFVLSGYVPPAQAASLKSLLVSHKRVDFGPLDEYLAEVTRLRQDALTSRSAADYSGKRVLDEEEAMERAEKRRKKEDEEKRKKAGQSQAVKNLQKVNVVGMKKMSDFFKKKA